MALLLIIVGVFLLLLSQQTGATVTTQNPNPTPQPTLQPPTHMTPTEIASVAAAAGFTGYDLTTAVAVALAESGGNVNAYNPEVAAGTPTGYGSYGLWQIYEKAHPEFATWNLFDPQLNAQAAFSVYTNAGGFRPWSTFNSGAYQAYLQTAQDAILQVS